MHSCQIFCQLQIVKVCDNGGDENGDESVFLKLLKMFVDEKYVSPNNPITLEVFSSLNFK